MKKYIAALIAVMLLISGSAVAENLFSGVALIEEKEIYYSGSVDGENLGVYILEKDGSAWQIYDTDAMLLEESDSSILLMDYITEQAILLSKEGTVLAQVSGYYGTAIEDDDWFYLGNIALSEDGSQQKVMFEVSAEELYYVTPVCVEEGYLYYIDEREYGPSTFGEGSMSTGSLCRVPLRGGEAEVVSGPGLSVVGIEEDCIVFVQQNFLHDGVDAIYEVQVDEGLFIYDTESGSITKLSTIETESENSYVYFDHVDDGIVYGTNNVYNEETGAVTTIIRRITMRGEELPEITVSDAALCAVDDGSMVLAQYSYYEDGAGNFIQNDKIIIYNAENDTNFVLNEGRNDMLFFTEANPDIVYDDGKVYWVSYNNELAALEFYCGDIQSGEIRMLAPGYSWLNMESVG